MESSSLWTMLVLLTIAVSAAAELEFSRVRDDQCVDDAALWTVRVASIAQCAAKCHHGNGCTTFKFDNAIEACDGLGGCLVTNGPASALVGFHVEGSQMPPTTTTLPSTTTLPPPTTTLPPPPTLVPPPTTTLPPTTTVPSCPQNTTIVVQLSTGPFIYSVEIATQQTWANAGQRCNDNGDGRLAVVNTTEKMGLLRWVLQNCDGYGRDDFWIDAYYFEAGPGYGNWRWTRDEALVPMTPDFWADGYPNAPIDKKCVKMENSQSHFLINFRCARTVFFICEYPASLI